MPIATGKISLRQNTANKTNSALLTAIMNFLINSGNYTLITNQIAAGDYFVVQSTRNTGFTGDKIIAQIGIQVAGGTYYWRPALTIRCYESWSGTTGTNLGTFRTGAGSTVKSGFPESWTHFNFIEDSDIWISCNDTFILAMSRLRTGNTFNDSGGNANRSFFSAPPAGVVAIERLAGDNDPGTFYGHFGVEQTLMTNRRIYVPKRFDNTTGDSSFFNLTTDLGATTSFNGQGLSGPDEGGSHCAFNLNAHLASSNKLKGRLFGVKVSTYGLFFGFGDLIPNTTSPKYIVGMTSSNDIGQAYSSVLMEVAPTITTITL